jgi:hypothetical protein
MSVDDSVTRKEFAGARFGDRRLTSRLQQIAARVEANPDLGFPVCMTEGELEAFYRFLSNDRVDFDTILSSHVDATVARCAMRETVLSVEDTTHFRFGTPREGLGRGLFAHVALAVSLDGTPLGVLGAMPWARAEDSASKMRHRKALTRRECASMPNEFDRWLDLVERVQARAEDRASLIHVMDSEADDYRLLCNLATTRRRFVVRSCHDRVLDVRDSGFNLREFMATRPVTATREVVLARRNKTRHTIRTKRSLPRESRDATLTISAGAVRLARPKLQLTDLPRNLEVNIIWVREAAVPDGEVPVDWMLVTTEPIETPEQILAVIDMYRQRWKIEELFKALKTGCAFEQRQLETYRTLTNALALLLPIAWNLLLLRSVARTHAQKPAESVLSPTLLETLRLAAEKPLPRTPTVDDVMLAIARMGGHLKRNGAPGWMVLGRGYEKLLTLTQGFMLARRCDQS